jgi:hypothetical protein
VLEVGVEVAAGSTGPEAADTVVLEAADTVVAEADMVPTSLPPHHSPNGSGIDISQRT